MAKESATDKIIRLAKERVDKKLKERETCSLCFYLQDFTEDWRIPDNTPEILIRQILVECIPPLLIETLVKEFINET